MARIIHRLLVFAGTFALLTTVSGQAVADEKPKGPTLTELRENLTHTCNMARSYEDLLKVIASKWRALTKKSRKHSCHEEWKQQSLLCKSIEAQRLANKNLILRLVDKVVDLEIDCDKQTERYATALQIQFTEWVIEQGGKPVKSAVQGGQKVTSTQQTAGPRKKKKRKKKYVHDFSEIIRVLREGRAVSGAGSPLRVR